MHLTTMAFNSMREATDFINEKGIRKEDIVTLFQAKEGLYFLSFYEEI